MHLYIYCDESGVFDKNHNNFYVISGYIFLNQSEISKAVAKYDSIEKDIRKIKKIPNEQEIKASFLRRDFKSKRRLLNSLNNYTKFAIIIKLQEVIEEIYNHKRDKQRFQDYAFSRGIKEVLLKLKNNKILNLDEIENITVNFDNRPIASSGKYDLKTSLLKELHDGKFNINWDWFIPGILKNLKNIKLNYLNSKNNYLIRASDIVANSVWHKARLKPSLEDLKDNQTLYIIKLP
ncbi:DUF3800 domain-containing protein [Mycoplasmopsis cynos]|uniref:DUF3800 domain-containing protein n=1 Tax=Mycoplasmopsis cynos TaxID=171284 RepID=UPI002AFE8C7F|nr:DUF3800 domain-containing protein [Mycoplasmopsis cynos]WQQ17403.1 DUF3800 domain-containing protein [Mycoplasmopsis cynos]